MTKTSVLDIDKLFKYSSPKYIKCSAEETLIQSWCSCERYGFESSLHCLPITVTPQCSNDFLFCYQLKTIIRKRIHRRHESGVFRNRKSTYSVSSWENCVTSSASVRCQDRETHVTWNSSQAACRRAVISPGKFSTNWQEGKRKQRCFAAQYNMLWLRTLRLFTVFSTLTMCSSLETWRSVEMDLNKNHSIND